MMQQNGASGGIVFSRMLNVPRPADTRAGPEPGWIETIGAAFRAGRAEKDGHENEPLMEAYGPVMTALSELGYKPSRYIVETRGYGFPVNEGRLWADVAEARRKNPNALAGVEKDQASFRARVIGAYKAATLSDDEIASRGGVVPNLIGGIAAEATDAVNVGVTVLTGGLAAAPTIGRAFVREAIINAAIETAQQPVVAYQRQKTDRTLTPGEAAMNITAGALFGGTLSGAGKAIELKGGAVVDAVRDTVAGVRERSIAGVWDRLPESVRSRWASEADIDDSALADIAEATIGPDRLSAEERAAVQLLRREAATAETNPFVANGAGVAMHRQRLDETLSALVSDLPERLAEREFSPRPRLAGDTALATGSVATPAPGRVQIKAMIGRAESPSDTARNPMSSATGRYQFVRGTWLAYHRRVFGGDMTDAQRWAQATDGRVQEVLMDALLEDNAAFLRASGEAETAGNLYLVHFAGQGGARKLFDADPSTPVERVLGRDVIRANPFLEGMTAGDAIAWAHRRMGGPVPARSGARAVLADGADESGYRAQLQAEIDELQARMLADGEAATVPGADIPALLAAREGEPVASVTGGEATIRAVDGPAEGMAARPVDTAKMADMLPDAQPLVKRVPTRTPPIRRRPSDIIEFLSDRGGINDFGGHDLRKGRGFGTVKRFGTYRLIRDKGMDLDQAGEALHEAGYFRERPTEAQVLDALERAVNQDERIYTLHEAADMAARARDREQAAYTENRALQLPDDFPLKRARRRDREAIVDVLREMDDSGADAFAALTRLIDEQVQNFRQRAYEEAPDAIYQPAATVAEPPDGRFDGNAAAWGAGSKPAGASARGSRMASFDQGEPGRAPPEALKSAAEPFDDPTGPAVREQADSIEHDARAALDRGEETDPAIAERQRQEAALGAAAPMRARADQDSLIGSPLFDAADQTVLRFEDGQDRMLRDVLDQLDRDAAAIDQVRSCL
jgi:hypothetical protein